MNKPYILINVVTSLDGRVSIGPNLTMWELLADPRIDETIPGEIWTDVDKKLKSTYNIQADLLGSNALVKEGEALKPLPPFEGDSQALYHDYLPEEIVNRPDHQGWMVAVDGRGRLRSGYKGEDNPGWHMLHLVSFDVPPEYLAFLQNKKIPYLIAGDKKVDLKTVMEKIKTKLGVDYLITSSGGRLSGALLRAGLVDEVNVVFKPQLYGGFETPCLFDSPELNQDEKPTELKLIAAVVERENYLWVRYKVEGTQA